MYWNMSDSPSSRISIWYFSADPRDRCLQRVEGLNTLIRAHSPHMDINVRSSWSFCYRSLILYLSLDEISFQTWSASPRRATIDWIPWDPPACSSSRCLIKVHGELERHVIRFGAGSARRISSRPAGASAHPGDIRWIKLANQISLTSIATWCSWVWMNMSCCVWFFEKISYNLFHLVAVYIL